MAIDTNDPIWKYGTEDFITAGGGTPTTSTVASAAFSVAGDVISGGWTNDEQAMYASFTLVRQKASGTFTTGGVYLYARMLDLIGTLDTSTPSGNFPHYRLGVFPTNPDNTANDTDFLSYTGIVRLPVYKSSQVFEFYVFNNSGVQFKAGWYMKIQPLSPGPKPA